MKKEYMTPEIRVVLLNVKCPMLNAVSPYEWQKNGEEEVGADEII